MPAPSWRAALLASAIVTSSGAPAGSKHATRAAVLARRDALTAVERAAASARICDATLELLARIPAGSTIALYAAKASEVDLAPLDAALRARGHHIAYPRVHPTERALDFALATPAELVAAPRGLREPSAGARGVALAELAALVVPGVAFDRAGNRLGWGRGHDDATLAAARHAYAIGVAFDCQLVDAVAAEPHDVAVRAVITERATHEREHAHEREVD